MNRNKFFILSSLVYLTALGIIALRINAIQNAFTYVLDDTYIHLAMARNLALHGIYGINPSEFSSASSAPLFTLLLAALIRIFGDNQLIPLYINIISGGAVLYVLSRFLPERPEKGSRVLAVILALISPLLLNLPALVFTGMEHLLHAALTSLAFLYLCSRVSEQPGNAPDSEIVPAGMTASAAGWAFAGYCLLVLVLPLLRFESMFFLAPVFFIWLFIRRYREAVVTVLLPAAAVITYGIVNKAMGGWFFPNSVMLKSKVTSLTLPFVLQKVMQSFIIDPFLLLFLLLLPAALYLFRGSRAVLPAVVYPVNTLLHVALAGVWYWGRYEVYLIVLGTAALADLYSKFYHGRGFKLRWQVLALALMVVFSVSGFSNAVLTSLAANNIYQQQYQMAMLAKEYLTVKDALFVNDIGAVAYFGPSRVVDLVGLASFEVAEARRNKAADREFYGRLTARYKPRLVIIYESWFPGRVPPEWIKVATWTMTKELITPADSTVTFYLLKENLPLKQKIAAYSRDKLPRDVAVRFY